jgi:DNA-binding MarR family transcriptional regulator
MGDGLRKRIQQEHFASSDEEAILNVLVTADHLRSQMDRLCGAFGISASQYNVLRILRGIHPDGHSRCEIVRRMLERAPDVTRLIDRLVKRGLVERCRGSRDRRLSISRITASGLELLDRMAPAVDQVSLDFAARVSPEDCQRLSRICESIYAED